MIVEECGKFPRPLVGVDAVNMKDIIMRGETLPRYDGRFDGKGRLRVHNRAAGEVEPTLWGSNLLGWDPQDHRIKCKRNWIQVYKADDRSEEPLQTIDSSNFRRVDRFIPPLMTVQEGGFLPAYPFNSSFCSTMRCSFEDILLEARKEKPRFLGQPTVALIRVTDPELVGEQVFALKFAKSFVYDPRIIDVVVLRVKDRTLVERQIIYPFVSKSYYNELAEGAPLVSYNDIQGEDFLGPILVESTLGVL